MTRRSFQTVLLVLYLLLFTISANAQELKYRLGEVLFTLTDQTKLSEFKNSLTSNTIYRRANFAIDPVSEAFNVMRIRFNPNQIHQIDFLESLRRNPFVAEAQLNHFLEKRTIPDDPFFEDQWHLYNTGQEGGTPGVDLDMHLAWGQTTGGLSYTGDTIVICIIDDYFNYLHNDLQANVWFNYQEIPGNGIDDDGNGYIDDYYGWNVGSSDDDISNGILNDWHGTAVAGIAGAVGDNGKGISGVCWNIKMMLVSRGSTTADAIAAYTYPFVNRKLYNQSQGQQGAYVVATNASFGLDFAFPSDAPLWCAMYDSLGSVGILNSAATSNLNNNVDVVGDLPTTCTSPYLITTTSVDNHDQKVEDAGYGATSIDLAAFGTSVLSTFELNSYNYLSGTSAAAPQITGAIGLLHSAPCPSFANFAKTNPSAAALSLKSYIMDGVEYNNSLENITVTDGRLNVNNSLNLLMSACDYSGCFTPHNVNVTVTDTNSVQVGWSVELATIEVNARYRIIGTSNWIALNTVYSPLSISNLSTCTDYELQLQSICNNAESAFTASFIFTTEGCCTAPGNISLAESEETIVVDWAPVSSATAYNVKYRETGATNWETIITQQSFYQIIDLSSCQEYEIQIGTICPGNTINYSAIMSTTTQGCGACLDNSYCSASGAIQSSRWISNIKIMDWFHYSSLDISGYQDFTSFGTNLTQGGVHALEIETDSDFFTGGGIFHIWIDMNQDGTFDDEELLYLSSEMETFVNDILAIPTDALLGATRMRIAFAEETIDPCSNFSLLGEVEDYCMFIMEADECLPPINYAVESNETAAIASWSGDLFINEYTFNYKALGTNEDWQTLQTFNNNVQLSYLSPCTDYIYFVSALCDGEESAASSLQSFRTKGCGICLDAEYCDYFEDNSTEFEWIEKVKIDTFEYLSGNDMGYLHKVDLPVNLEIGQTYSIQITPGFPNEHWEEFYFVWLDANGDGIFQTEESVTQGASIPGSAFTGTLHIPEFATPGSTRLRVSMKYGTTISDPCESGFEGETEDYCVNLIEPESMVCSNTFISQIEGLDSTRTRVQWESYTNASSYRLRYRPLATAEWAYLNTAATHATIHTNSCEMYVFQVQTHCPQGWSTYSESVEFNACQNVVPVSEVASISEYKFNVFPNPFQRLSTLQMDIPEGNDLQIEIFSVLGQKVKEYSFAELRPGSPNGQGSFSGQIELGPFDNGIYILRVLADGKLVYTSKLIAQAP